MRNSERRSSISNRDPSGAMLPPLIPRSLDSFRGEAARRRGFTLVELVVVLAIIAVLVAMIVPGANAMLRDRKITDAETLLQGMLKTARADALRAEAVETGLLFFVDASGRQRIVGLRKEARHIGEPAWENVFIINADRSFALPDPIRVVPRYAIEPDDPQNQPRRFSDTELANNDFNQPPPPYNEPQRHRNVFSMIYAPDGQLVVGRDVLVLDEDADSDGFGDVTDMTVNQPQAPAQKYYTRDDQSKEFPPEKTGKTVPVLNPPPEEEFLFIVVDPDNAQTALNFASVDGLLVYDDDVFREQSDPAGKRAYLLESARPYYVNRYTGEIIPGARGENATGS